VETWKNWSGPVGLKRVDGPYLRINIMDFSQGFGFKTKDSNTFKSKFQQRPNYINLNKLFEDFSNLKLLKISLNIQIQTNA
jgi:hypothetical protein